MLKLLKKRFRQITSVIGCLLFVMLVITVALGIFYIFGMSLVYVLGDVATGLVIIIPIGGTVAIFFCWLLNENWKERANTILIYTALSYTIMAVSVAMHVPEGIYLMASFVYFYFWLIILGLLIEPPK